MKHKLKGIMTLFFLIISFSLFSQSVIIVGITRSGGPCYWIDDVYFPLEGGGRALDVYIDGEDFYITGESDVGHWKNGSPVYYERIGDGLSIYISDGDVYVAGHIDGIPGYWKNGVWNRLGTRRGFAEDILIHDSKIYCIGWVRNDARKQVAGYWEDGVWFGYEPMETDFFTRAVEGTIKDGRLISGGYGYYLEGIDARVPTIWTFNQTNHLSQLDQNKRYTEITGIKNINGSIYATGWSTSSDNVWVAGYWKDSVWHGFTKNTIFPDYHYSGFSFDIALINDTLITVGRRWKIPYEGSSAPNIPGYWENDTWVPLPIPASAREGEAWAIGVF